MEALAEPGGILVSGTAYDHVKNNIKVSFDDLGTQTLKNIAEPVRVYRVTGTQTISITQSKAATDRPSVAVLPFTNMSGDPEQQYFSDGITEDIITELSRFRAIFVIARNSSFQYRDKAVDVRRIARELGAHYVVEGSVRKVATRIRITVQLVEAAGGTHLWADRYDRPVEDVFAIQDEVVRTIVATLAGRLEATGAEGLRRRPTASLSAYECALRGNALPIGDPADEAAAHQLFEQAVALDPDYALAHAKLAISHVRRWMQGMSGSSKELDRAFELAARAVSLDAQEIVCHTALSYIQLCRRRYDEAEFHARKALALNPNRPNALAAMAEFLVYTGRPDEAVLLMNDAMRLDPSSSGVVLDVVGTCAFYGATTRGGGCRTEAPSEPSVIFSGISRRCLRAIGRRSDHGRRGGRSLASTARLFGGRLLFAEPYKVASDREHLADSLRKAGLPE